jgi:branched-subunit amino acid ABC-type transport system permease component
MYTQLIANGMIAGSLWALLGVSFGVVLRATGFFDFSYGLAVAVGAYVTFALSEYGRLPMGVAMLIALLAAGATGVAVHGGVFGMVKRQTRSALGLLLASVGVYVIGQNVLSLTFGDSSHSIRGHAVSPGFVVLGARITTNQLVIIGTSLGTILVLGLVASQSRIGRQVRAMANNRFLAEVVGIPVRKATYCAVFVGFLVGGLAGILLCLDGDMVPTMGMKALLVAVVAAIVGGERTVSGVCLGGFAIGILQNLAIVVVPAAWEDAIAFLVLLLFLALSPRARQIRGASEGVG